MEAVYKKLLKIKNPVLIEVEWGRHFERAPGLDRYRILYPDGRCEYAYVIGKASDFYRACFCSTQPNLDETVKAMYRFDSPRPLTITKIQEIK